MPRFLSLPFLVVFLLLSQLAFAQEGYGDSESKFHINGEAGAAFFDTGPNGEFPNSEFRADEAKVFLEAEIVSNIYFFGEVNLVTREKEDDATVHLGELYVEFGNISKGLLNVRLGRFDIPFGEEYLSRDVIDNPFVTHSLSDIWGVDEGAEVFGSLKGFEYVFAVQNGGDPELRDFNSDKAVVAKLAYKFLPVRLTFSAMRTGKIDVEGDRYSEVWFGNGFLRLLGSRETTTTFEGRFVQGEGDFRWKEGHLQLGGGDFRYDDNDISADNARNVHYFQIEAVQNFASKQESTFYSGARFSTMRAALGFPMVGNGNFEAFLFDNNLLTTRLSRISFTVGYRFKKNLLLKAEYNFERGDLLNGFKREDGNFFGAEAAVKF